MDEKHLQGPWNYQESGNGGEFHVIDGDGKRLGSCINEDVARLMAQSPMLAKALNVLIDHVLHYASMHHAHSDAHKDVANARAELIKALGVKDQQDSVGSAQVASLGT